MFAEARSLSKIKTRDIDIDVSLLINASKRVSIPDLLFPLGFETKFAGKNFIFLVHPALKIEFLSPEIGKTSDKPLMLPGFGISAQPLRFLHLLENEIITVDYKGFPVKVPHPVWFAIHKLIISQRRRSKRHNEKMKIQGKSHKDSRQAIEVLAALCQAGQKVKITDSLETLTKKQKKLLWKAVEEHRDHIEVITPQLVDILTA